MKVPRRLDHGLAEGKLPVQHAAVLPELDRILRLLSADAEWQVHLRRYR